ncbi:MAG: polyphenol oxidase [Legionellales bacterium RIFCSPHIGHO2_12_FULL_37_14]|nr:MAG: polyphenol oxidase [Legionellales bacterium RIFCSPHIGHO2_12_FULL_37_14]
MTFNCLVPKWPAPTNINACVTTRNGGISKGQFASLNLGDHVGDTAKNVFLNRSIVNKNLQLKQDPIWLNQTHSTICIDLDTTDDNTADAVITKTPYKVLAIMTADCLPILLCDLKGKEIAAIHAGWRGLCNGIIENTLANMSTPKEQLIAYLGPSICGKCYEVRQDVYDLFSQKYAINGFTPYHDKWLLNKPLIATHILKSHNVNAIYLSNRCTFEEKEQFFSYRRDKETGRMASLIWIKEKIL